MGGFDPTDLLLFGIGSFIAVSALVRLMRARRDQLSAQLHDELKQQQHRRQMEQKKKRQAENAADRKAS